MPMRTEDLSLSPAELPWHSLGNGAFFKFLRYSPETGAFSIILRVDKGGTFKAHYHEGAAEYLMLKGKMSYTNGIATAGDYGYEALHARHTTTQALEDMEMFFIGYGPIIFQHPDGSVEAILDGELLRSIASGEAATPSFTNNPA